jgi:hypothetical protein
VTEDNPEVTENGPDKDKEKFIEDKTSGKEVEHFLEILLGKVTHIHEVTNTSNEETETINFDNYSQFRDEMSECISFLIIIERHLSKTIESRRLKLAEKFDELTVAVWSILLEGSLGFLKILSLRHFLPIGTKHIFMHELRTLYDAEKVLHESRLKHLVTDTVLKRRNSAERILHEVIDRAPQLLQLT